MAGLVKFIPRIQRITLSIISRCVSTSVARNVASKSLNKTTNFAGISQQKLLENARAGAFIQARFMSADPDSEKEITERVLHCLKCYEKICPDTLKVGDHFMKDLGLDSLDHVEIIVAIENEFGFEIPDNAAELLLTPQEIIAYVCDQNDIDG